MIIVILAVLIGLIPAAIAQSKGQPFVGWWIYGALLFIVALPHSLMLKPDLKSQEQRAAQEGMKKCPECAEMVKGDARICRYCKHEFFPVNQD